MTSLSRKLYPWGEREQLKDKTDAADIVIVLCQQR